MSWLRKNKIVSNAIFCPNDLQNINLHNQLNQGQIGLHHAIGKFLYDYAKDLSLHTYLEIGTWNGLGSTKCIIDGLKTRTDDYVFYSLECNTDKSNYAQKLYKDVKNVFILNEVLLNDMPSNIEDVFPELKSNPEFARWNKIDFDNMKNKPLFLNRTELPEIFDVILLDGGEFTTYYEYLKLKDKCKILILDDTNVCKCQKIVEDIKSQPTKWKIISESNERNGTVVAINISIQ